MQYTPLGSNQAIIIMVVCLVCYYCNIISFFQCIEIVTWRGVRYLLILLLPMPIPTIVMQAASSMEESLISVLE